MRLPALERRYVPLTKVTRYLLDVDHSQGGSKAQFFLRFGFDPAYPEVLLQSLLDHGAAHEVAQATLLPAGWTYVVEGPLVTPDGRHPKVRSIWLLPPAGAPYLITAYPARRR